MIVAMLLLVFLATPAFAGDPYAACRSHAHVARCIAASNRVTAEKQAVHTTRDPKAMARKRMRLALERERRQEREYIHAH